MMRFCNFVFPHPHIFVPSVTLMFWFIRIHAKTQPGMRITDLFSRIRPLSDAVGDLYRQFNTLKNDLAKLTSKFDGVEAFVDDLKHGRVSVRQRPAQRVLPNVGLRSPLRAQMRSPVRGIMNRPALITRRGPPNMRSKGV